MSVQASLADAPRAATSRMLPGWLAALVVCSLYGGLALSVDFPKTAGDIQSDEATYYLMAYSLAADHDLAYREADLQRAFREFPNGPSGVFLKKGRTVTSVRPSIRPPFFDVRGYPDRDEHRLFYGKAFIYPAVAAPFVWLMGTNGFLVLHTLLLGLVTLAGYAFLSARMKPAVALLLSTAFVFATAVPVYFVWITPELFNFAIVFLAFFCFFYKEVAPAPAADSPGVGVATRWLRTDAADIVAAFLIGLATFSKISNALAFLPLGAWLLWQGKWRRLAAAGIVWVGVTEALFGLNVAITGDWNYQGGERRTFYGQYAFEQGHGFEVGQDRGRDEALTNVIFDRQVFWLNLRSNLWYALVGRNAGLVAYFFPGVFAAGAFLLRRPRERWQWLVLAGAAGQLLLFVVSQPYTFIGSGGSVGNRYFMGAYGLLLFVLPPIESIVAAAVPWIVGGFFVGAIVLNPFYSSIVPAERTKAGPLRMFPFELTNVNDLPINTETARVRIWYGDNPGIGDPGFQIYYLDDNAYLREADKSFWVRGESRAEVLIKAEHPFRRLQLTLSAGQIGTDATVTLHGKSEHVSLAPGQAQQLTLDLGPGFPYKKDEAEPVYVWVMSIASTKGYTPILLEPESRDTRYLGVRVKPIILP
jgi:hypothetical protein